jgi:hypothetical protein
MTKSFALLLLTQIIVAPERQLPELSIVNNRGTTVLVQQTRCNEPKISTVGGTKLIAPMNSVTLRSVRREAAVCYFTWNAGYYEPVFSRGTFGEIVTLIDGVAITGSSSTMPLSPVPRAGAMAATDKPYEWILAEYRDPASVQWRNTCVQWASGDWPWGGGWKECSGSKTEQNCSVRRQVLVAQSLAASLSIDKVVAAVNACKVSSAIASAIAAYYSGGSAAGPAFVGSLTACVSAQLASTAFHLDLQERSGETGWGKC